MPDIGQRLAGRHETSRMNAQKRLDFPDPDLPEDRHDLTVAQGESIWRARAAVR